MSRRNYRWMKAFFVIAIALLLHFELYGQSQAIDGNIDGYVTSEDGAGISGAHIKITNVNTGISREAESGENGYYIQQLLPTGTYEVTVAKEPFAASRRTNIEVAVGAAVRVDLKLGIGEAQTTVQVNETGPMIEVERTTANSYVFSETEARNIILATRSLMEFYELDPAMNSAAVSTGGSGTSTASLFYGGFSNLEFNVDGVSNNLQNGSRNVVISAEAISQYQTLTNFSAEFGRVVGPILSAVSRSGSNTWHGSGYLYAKNAVLSAWPFLSTSTTRPDFSRYNYGGTVSGPIKKDRAFFFANYERWMQNLPVVSTFGGSNQAAILKELGISPSDAGTWTTTFRAHTVTVKSDIVLNSKNRLALRYNTYHDAESPLNGGQITRQASAAWTDFPHAGTAQLVTEFKPTVINEFRFLRGLRPVGQPVLAPNNPAVSLSGIGTFNGNASGNYKYFETGYQIIDNLTWNKGRHSFKFGFDILPVNYQDTTSNLNGTFTFSGLTANDTRGAVSADQQYLYTVAGTIDPSTGLAYNYSQFSQSTGAKLFDASDINQGYFAQDEIRINARLKATLGLRYELFYRPSGNLNPAYTPTGNSPQSFTNLAPRTALAWDPWGNQKNVVRVGYGIYYNPTTPATYEGWERQNGVTVKSVTIKPTQTGAPAFTLDPVETVSGGTVSKSSIYYVDNGFKDLRVQSWNVGIDHELAPGYSVSISYLANHADHLSYTVPGNLVTTGSLADGRVTYSGYTDTNFGVIYSVHSDNTYQNFNAVLAEFTGRIANRLTAHAGYQFQHVYGCIDRTTATTTGYCFDNGAGTYNQPQRFVATVLWSPNLHFDNALMNKLVKDWQFGNNTIIQSGLPFTPVTGSDLNGDTTYSDRPVGMGYHTYQLPTYYEIDMRADRTIRVGEKGSLEVFAEALNVPNHENVTTENTTWGTGTTPNSTFKQATAAETQREFQLGLRYSF